MKLLVFLLALLPLVAFSQEAARSAALPLGAFSQEAARSAALPVDTLASFMGEFAASAPWLLALSSLSGLLRWFLKPLMSALHNYVEHTPGDADNKALARVEHSTAFRVFAYLLDWFASIKLTRPESFSSTTKLFAPLLLAGALAGLTGCASIHQTATSSIAPDGTETRTVNLRVTALGDAKQAIEKLATQSGKTVSAGATGASQETTSDSLKTLLELLKQVGAAK